MTVQILLGIVIAIMLATPKLLSTVFAREEVYRPWQSQDGSSEQKNSITGNSSGWMRLLHSFASLWTGFTLLPMTDSIPIHAIKRDVFWSLIRLKILCQSRLISEQNMRRVRVFCAFLPIRTGRNIAF
jgi:hypothetical protein